MRTPKVETCQYIYFSDLEKWLQSKIDFGPFDQLELDWLTPYGNDHLIMYDGLNVSEKDRKTYPLFDQIEALIKSEFEEILQKERLYIYVSW